MEQQWFIIEINAKNIFKHSLIQSKLLNIDGRTHKAANQIVTKS